MNIQTMKLPVPTEHQDKQDAYFNFAQAVEAITLYVQINLVWTAIRVEAFEAQLPEVLKAYNEHFDLSYTSLEQFYTVD